MLLACTASRSRVTCVMMSELVYHEIHATHNAEALTELRTHTPRLRVRVTKIGSM